MGRFYKSNHAAHYLTAYNIFLNHPIFGIGINNFHKESIKDKYENKKLLKTNFRSSTHPHQLYLEIASETGLTGIIYFIFIFFYPVFLCLKALIKNKQIYLISNLLLHFYFIFQSYRLVVFLELIMVFHFGLIWQYYSIFPKKNFKF